jgi:hypothetical protein
MPQQEPDTCEPFHPEEAGIMLDRLAIELLHAQAKNPRAIPELQAEAHELLACVRAWFASEAGGADISKPAHGADKSRRDPEPSVDVVAIAGGLREIADHLLFLAEIDEARGV